MPDEKSEIDRVSYREIAPCQWQASLWLMGFPSPVALVWYEPGETTITINHTFTIQFYRRRGLMRHLFDHLRASYPGRTLVTFTGTEEGGKAFLDAYGFTKQEPTPLSPWGYYCTPRPQTWRR